ncbi:hypothetical protein BD626DRAFT_107195 [Schizophyllum amplum]|uniref:SET domain-containing protein n=1 Tax=Schizophyllum amplum TaxID=97359 RepID=A0A550CSV3_9AGAR|nr:hypothetical protein BD626DRAFT_107195 [Auriculariopsis ampla]
MSSKIEGYFHHFPPKSFNVAIETKASTTMPGSRSVLVAKQDFKAGDLIYKEYPVIATLDHDLHEAGTHCNHCLRAVDPESAITTSDNFKSTFCSSDCQIAAKIQYQNLLFSLEPPLPPQMSLPQPTEQAEKRKTAQEALVGYLAAHPSRDGPALLVAELVARQLALETEKMITTMMPGAVPKAPGGDFADAEGGGYLLADHVERLRFLEAETPEEEVSLLSGVLSAALPGLEAFVTPERYTTFLGKIAYNAFGVCYNGGRLDRPETYTDKTRTPFGTSHQIGSAFYTVSSYLSHSCTPSARPSFDGGNAELHLIATRDIAQGEELSVAFVDVAQPADVRRAELQAGWKFGCTCEKCTEENDETGEAVEDASKLEPTMKRFENQA